MSLSLLLQQNQKCWTFGHSLCGILGLVLLVFGCSRGGDNGGLQPSGAREADLEIRAITELLNLYRTAIVQEDIDRLQELLQPENALSQQVTVPLQNNSRQEGQGAAVDVRTFREAMSEAFRTVDFLDLLIPEGETHITSDRQRVTFLELESVEDPVALVQRTRAFYTTFNLIRDVAGTTTTFRIAAVTRDGPIAQITTPGRIVAGTPTRITVTPGSAMAMSAVEVTVPEITETQVLAARDGVFYGIFQAPVHPHPQPLRIRLQRDTGADIILSHHYRLRMPGDGVVQPIGPLPTTRFFAVTVAPDATVWFGGQAERSDAVGTIVQTTADGQTTLRLTQPRNVQLLAGATARIEDIVVDQRGRFHFLFVAQVNDREIAAAGGVVGSGDVVLDPHHSDLFCQTVNILDANYPFYVQDLQSASSRPSPSTRAAADVGGGIWLFGSDGGVGLVTDTFNGEDCTPASVGVTYQMVFQRQAGALLSNTVPALVVSAAGPRWFGTALGVTRLTGERFVSALFNPSLAIQGNITTKEGFFREVAQAIFTARPVKTLAIGNVSFIDAFGRGLAKEDLIFSAVEDAAGRLWAGTVGGGVRRLESRNGTVQDTLLLTRQNGLVGNIVFALAVTPPQAPGTAIWAATEEGVSRIEEMDGVIVLTTFSALDGLVPPIHDIAVDGQGTVWLATEKGMFQIARQGGLLRGEVRDAASHPVVGADIIIPDTPFRAVTDAEGRFVLTALPLGARQLLVDGGLARDGPFTSMVREISVTAGEQSLEAVTLVSLEALGPLQLVLVSGDGQREMVGSSLSRPLVVAIEDTKGNRVPGLPVTFTIVAGRGQLSTTRVVTDASGQAATTLLVTDVGSVTVEATSVGRGVIRFQADGVPERPDIRLVLVSGNNQVVEPGTLLPAPLVVRLEDQFGPRRGEMVVADVVAGEGNFSGQSPNDVATRVTVETDAQGEARFFLQAGSSQGDLVTRVTAREQEVQFLTVVGFGLPVVLAVGADGHLIVADRALRALLQVDPQTGTRSLVSGRGRGSGPPLIDLANLAVEADGQIIVASGKNGAGAILRVDPVTGNRVLVSGLRTDTGEKRGRGLESFTPGDIAVETNGQLIVLVPMVPAILRIDPMSGDRTVVSGCLDFDTDTGQCRTLPIGPGPLFVQPLAIAIEASGQLVVVDSFLDTVFQVDPITGLRQVVSEGGGPPFFFAEAIVVEADGRFVVGDFYLHGLARVNPNTGVRTPLSGCTDLDRVSFQCIGSRVGNGPDFQSLEDVAIETDGSLVAVDSVLRAVVRVDPVTGNRAIVSQGTRIGNGPRFTFPRDITIDSQGQLVVVDPYLQAVGRIDPVMGTRTVLSGCTTETSCTEPRGQGPLLQSPAGIAIEANGNLVITDFGLKAVVRIDKDTGNRTSISGCSNPASCGPLLQFPVAIAVESNGQFVVVDIDLHAIIRVDAVTGTRTIVADADTGDGPLQSPVAIAVESDGHLVVLDTGLPAVLRVDPVTGKRTVVSDNSMADSPPLKRPVAIAVEATGQLFVGDADLIGVIKVDPSAGSRRIVSSTNPLTGATMGNGPPFVSIWGIAVESSGQLVIGDAGLGGIVRVDSRTGNRTIISR